ncbi:hypothetical protein Tco_0856183, partial [Tanacetum coccineum]
MELENSQSNSLAKLPILKLGEYEMWEIRIKQYFQIQDYALWEVIENGNFLGLQKLVSRLAILGVDTPPEDLNVWNLTFCLGQGHSVKRTVAVNNDDKNLAFLTTSSPSSTNTINTVNTGVSTGNTKVNTASTETSTASLSDATVYAFLSTQPQGSQLVHEDLEQIHDDDLLVKLDDTAFKAATYKRGLLILEAQVVKYKESKVLFSEEIALLKRSVGHKDYLMGLVKTELEKVKKYERGIVIRNKARLVAQGHTQEEGIDYDE